VNLLEKIYDSAADRLVPNDADSATITSDIVAAHGSRTPRQLFNIFINTMMWMLDMRRKALSIPTAGRLVLPTSFLTLQKTSVVMGRLWFLDQTQRPGGRTRCRGKRCYKPKTGIARKIFMYVGRDPQRFIVLTSWS